MNKFRFVWGIICLVLAGGLAVLNLALPGKVYYLVDDKNYPWLPPIVFLIVGIVLLATAGIGKPAVPKAEQPKAPPVVVDPQKAALNKRLESIAWGCFLILLGGFIFIPDDINTKGWWSIGVGLIFLGLNLARYLNKLKMSGFTTVLGILGVVGGIVQIFSAQNFEGAFLLIILGLYLIFKQWFDKNKLFGKAEEV